MGDGDHLALPATAELSLTVETPAADRTVTVAPGGSLRFDPESLEVSVGETVEWVWDAGGHNVSVESQPDDGDWPGKDDQFTYDEGTTHRHTFEAPGTYEYVCQPHQTSGMVGTVTVTDS
jgi:plastocyanin